MPIASTASATPLDQDVARAGWQNSPEARRYAGVDAANAAASPPVSPPQNAPPPPQGNSVPAPAPAAGYNPATVVGPVGAAVLNRIAAGETGNDPDPYHRLYGSGGHFGFPQWSGQQGPAGPTHAAGRVQWEPATWEKAASEYVASGRPAPDFNKPADQDAVGWFHAQKIYKQHTGRDLATDAQAGKVDWNALAGEWPSLNPHGAALAKEDRDRLTSGMNDMQAMAQKYSAAASAAPVGSEERRAAFAEAQKAFQAAEQHYQELSKVPPAYKPIDMWQQFGSPAVIIAALGGLFARNHMTAALGAAGDAMQAQNQQNWDKFKIAQEQWKTSTDMAIQSVKMASEQIKMVLADEKMAYDEKQSALNQIATEYGMAKAPVEIMAKHQEALARAAQAAEFQAARLALMGQPKQMQTNLPNGVAVTGIPGNRDSWKKFDGTPLTDEEYKQLGQAGLTKFGSAQAPMPPALPIPDKWEGMPNSPPPGIRPDVWAATLAYVQTDKPPPVGWGNNPMRQQFFQAIPLAQHALGIKPTDQGALWAKYQGDVRRSTAIESAFGSGVAGKNLVSLNTVAAHIELLEQYANALKNKDYPLENQIINRMSTQGGMPQVIQFALARTITGDEVVRLLTTTGGTVEDRAGLQRLLSEYGSPAQLDGAIQTARQFVAERLAPLEQQYARNDPERRKTFEDEMLTPTARDLFLRHQGGASEGQPKQPTQSAPRVTTKEQYDSLPPGTHYVGPDGAMRVKGQ